MLRVVTMKKTWEVHEEEFWDRTDEADKMNLEVDSKDESILNEEMVGGRERMTRHKEQVLRGWREIRLW